MRSPQDSPTDPSELIRFATVSGVDLGAATCSVILDDDSEASNIPWLESRMGKTRIWSPPSIGEQVILLCPEGELSAAAALRGVPSDQFPQSGSTPIENITFGDGAVISYDSNAHTLSAILPAGGTLIVTADGGLTITGDCDISGDIVVTGKITVSDDVIADGISLVNHVHDKVSAGTALSGKPQ